MLRTYLLEALDNTKEAFFFWALAGTTVIIGSHMHTTIGIALRDTAFTLDVLAGSLRTFKAVLDWKVYFSARRILRH